MREGLLPHTVTTVLKLSTTVGRARAITELLGEVLDPGDTAVSAFEIDDEAEDSPWFVEVFFAEPPDQDAIRDLIGPIVGEDLTNAEFTAVDSRDWVKASLDGLKPVRAGRFLVHGAHDREAVRVNDIAIEIEAGLAFGTGHHGTTAGCLLAIHDELKRGRPRHVLDIGTGTGLLALAVAKRLKQRVVAGDIDAVAVDVTRANAVLNHAPGLLDLYVAPGVRHAKAARLRHFDLVIANILQRPLMRLARHVALVLRPSGTLVLSGLLLRDVAGVLAAYRMQGWTLARRSSREGWATLVLRRRGAAPRPTPR
ncbi:MAG: 50S ribosomal protein L11 methyltransferase [Bosea sp.]|jgi:ribosomal protein L11 methyltransferase|nr:50S ribosomal protein L11 methyltransferase [Bosea sp. (in: a-proteobacteria)]